MLGEALETYGREHHHYPVRVVLHKTSQFDDEEISGFESAVDERLIRHLELLWIVYASEGTRLFRKGDYPVLRGTFASIGERCHILYTRESVEFYRVYPGMYIPTSLGIRPAVTERSIEHLAEEVLALSKMLESESARRTAPDYTPSIKEGSRNPEKPPGRRTCSGPLRHVHVAKL